ncbi:hypothetical protein F4779DRAFT_470425 [Xylariaceae sp. FL0662B]|nr:hypothetical protein F4779DRAFT_470425 [Xylariaceae sp. FL0662B]
MDPWHSMVPSRLVHTYHTTYAIAVWYTVYLAFTTLLSSQHNPTYSRSMLYRRKPHGRYYLHHVPCVYCVYECGWYRRVFPRTSLRSSSRIPFRRFADVNDLSLLPCSRGSHGASRRSLQQEPIPHPDRDDSCRCPQRSSHLMSLEEDYGTNTSVTIVCR